MLNFGLKIFFRCYVKIDPCVFTSVNTTFTKTPWTQIATHTNTPDIYIFIHTHTYIYMADIYVLQTTVYKILLSIVIST
jgi:hypothetical protein